ncbi:hypothetical protein BDW59DRAFT_124464 [Aspergillus cavernicola]|uniref:Uncharacterized protein n=1 Tax=Aspergillus cavernicola TaxID=176166 RepID=A0ABR4IWS7_9EURO
MSNQQKRGSSDDSRPPNPTDYDDNALPAPQSDPQDPQSLATRIQKSASGLARNAFLSPAPSGDTAHFLSDGNKATPSSSSSSALAAAEQYRESSGPSLSSLRDQTNRDPIGNFRSSTAQSGGFELPGLTEDEFQNTYGRDWDEPLEETGKGKGKGKGTSQEPRLAKGLDETVTTLLPSDGDAVVSILTDKTFDPEFPPSATDLPECLDTELTPPQLTAAEIQMIESFRRQSPPESQPQQSPDQPHQLNPLSLVPDIGSFLDTLPASNTNASHATSLRDTVLTGLPGAVDWISVEENYHDEVWGYLQPTLEAAAKEIESKKDSSESEEGPAVQRLKMILKHMQH